MCLHTHTYIIPVSHLYTPLKKKTGWGLGTVDKVFVMQDGGPEFRAL